MIECLLGFEYAHLTDKQLMFVCQRLEFRGIVYTMRLHAGRHDWFVLVDFPEKGRNRFLRRHGEFLESLKEEIGQSR
jgi:hypothetical protein